MDSIVGFMKRIAAQELRRIQTTELGIVTAIFPHADAGDKDNYQCSIKLKNRKTPDGDDFELQKAPVVTPHIGMANIPNVGDLVLVAFVGGDINMPIIIGRLYNDEDLPPVNLESEFLIQHDREAGGALKLDSEGCVLLVGKDEESKIEIDGAKISLTNPKSSLTMEDDNAIFKNEECTVELSGSDITIENSSCKITIGSDGITIDAASSPITLKSKANIKIGDATTPAVNVGGVVPGKPLCNGDQVVLSSHTHVGNLGAPCPIMIPTDTLNVPSAAARNTQVG